LHPLAGVGLKLTGDSCATYSSTMPNPDHNRDAVARELQRVEARLDALLGVCRQLQEENRSLRQRQESLMSERAGLLQKNERARSRVEAMITRLKAMEHSA
jgi:cell division protein ZapB